jgi:hypothetical protein
MKPGVRGQGSGAKAAWSIILLGWGLALYLGVGDAVAQGQRQVMGELSPEHCRMLETVLRHEGTPARVDAGRLVVEGCTVYLELDCRSLRTAGGTPAPPDGWPYTRRYPLLEDVNRRPVLEE